MDLPLGFWAGLLVLPVLVIVLALAVVLTIGAWVLLEAWRRERFQRLHPTTPTGQALMPPGRVQHAALFLLAPKAWKVKLGFGCSLLLYRGANEVPLAGFTRTRHRLNELARELAR